MISRGSAMAIANAYTAKFSVSCRSGPPIRFNENELYDFLYECNYEAWFCNMAKKINGVRGLKDWLLKIHTGESLVSGTASWSCPARRELGQTYLHNLARDYLSWYASQPDSWVVYNYGNLRDELIRRFELDGYVYRFGKLVQCEVEVLDVETEVGLLEAIYSELGLSDKIVSFSFLKLAEDHYVAGRWPDCIGNARKFFESVLQQVAAHHSLCIKGSPLPETELQRAVSVRSYLESSTLLEKKEREAVDKIYGLLSHTGGHPYMAEQDQARLLRQICLSFTQFVMLRLKGALAKT